MKAALGGIAAMAAERMMGGSTGGGGLGSLLPPSGTTLP